MMKLPKTLLSLAAGSVLLASSAFAEATDPVGYTTEDIPTGADLKVAVPLTQAPSFVGAVETVASGTVNVAGTMPDVTTAAHFVWVTSGALEGKWYQVTGQTASSVTVAEDLAADGLVATDSFRVLPFWTLDTLFPAGGDIPQSSDVFNPVAQILLNDINALGINPSAGASYLYHDGAQGPAGWYDADDLGAGLQGDVIVSPASYITIRNQSGGAAAVTFVGSVPVAPVANNVLSRSAGSQDSQVPNPFPAGVTLSSSGLVDGTAGAIRPSSDVFNPLDQLLVFPSTPTGLNPATAVSYLFHDGTQGPAGWYDADNLGAGLQDGEKIPAAAALLVRRQTGADQVISWVAPLPYTL